MTDIDTKIRQALRDEEAELLAEFEHGDNMFEAVLETFRGRARWLVALAVVIGVVLMAFTVFAGFQFFEADSIREMIAWAVGVIFGVLGVMIMKLWYFMELNKNAVTREIKRVELQLALLAEEIRDHQASSAPSSEAE